MDELELDLGSEINKTEQRITDLSSKVKTIAGERDTANAKVAEAEAARLTVEKERDFYSGFSDTVSKYPNASEHKDAIKEKVLAGYSVEDATVSVLNKEGKLTPRVEVVPQVPAGGGSAINQPTNGAQKQVSEMTQAERRAALVEAEKRGDISLS